MTRSRELEVSNSSVWPKFFKQLFIFQKKEKEELIMKKIIMLLVAGFCFALYGCGGGGGGANVPPAASTGPEVTMYSPFSGQTSVPLNSVISMIFSTSLDSTSVNDSTIYLIAGNVADSTSSHVPGIPVITGVTVNFTPAAPLLANTVYTMVTKNVKNSAGQTSRLFAFTFSTGAVVTPPGTALSVLASTPVPNVTGVAIDAKPTITFSAALDATTVNSSNIRLMNGANQVNAAVTLNAAANVATIEPAVILSNNTVYTVVAAGVKDDNGNTLIAPFSANFTTTTAVVNQQPEAQYMLTTFLWADPTAGIIGTDKSNFTVATPVSGYKANISSAYPVVSGGQYQVWFTCTSTPVVTVEIKLQQNVANWADYAVASPSCNGTVNVTLTANTTDAGAWFHLNAGAIAANYHIGEIYIKKLN